MKTIFAARSCRLLMLAALASLLGSANAEAGKRAKRNQKKSFTLSPQRQRAIQGNPLFPLEIGPRNETGLRLHREARWPRPRKVRPPAPGVRGKTPRQQAGIVSLPRRKGLPGRFQDSQAARGVEPAPPRMGAGNVLQRVRNPLGRAGLTVPVRPRFFD